jgi:GNAT superfamily N-acetyltransferase
MQVRKLIRDDLPTLLEMNRKQIEESRFPHLKVNEKKMHNWYLNFINNPRSVVFVLIDDNGKLAGAAAAAANQFWWNYETYVNDYFFYVYPEHRKGLNAKMLYDAIYKWAAECRAIEIQLSYVYSDDPEKMARFYDWMGYRKVGEHYQKEVI